MGWETNVLSKIRFNKKTYNCLYDVEIDIADTEESINNIKQTTVFLKAIEKVRSYE